jgi:tetratricopeptide (TPR) repeat protein
VVYVVSVTDAKGRMLRQEELALSEFGTFHTEMGLDEGAPLGQYTVTARRKDNQGQTFAGTFLVQKFQLEKMKLKFSFPQKVYFRGETVEGEIAAEYYWGEPVGDKPVQYGLPDGRTFLEKTDATGKLKLKFDTTGMAPGSFLVFSASIEGENVSARESVFLANLGFNISVSASQELVLSGEPFEATVKTTGPDGKPVSAELTLFVLRTQTPKPDPVLSAVPWVPRPAEPSSEVTVSEHKLKTDEKTGVATVPLKLDKGGDYILRAAGPDRFGQTVTGEGRLKVSDEEDETKLRFFADKSTLQVGAQAEVRLHSRVPPGLALLTYEGEEIISYQVTQLQKGYNKLEFGVGHEHFPNFRLAVALMDKQELRTASKDFKVERELKVTVKPVKDVVLPGQDAQIELTVTDQLGKPVKAELSLALVDEALFAIFPDTTPKILDFFQRDARRHAELRAISTCGFKRQGLTKRVIKAYLEEKERLARVEQDKAEMAAARELSAPMAKTAATPPAPDAVAPGESRYLKAPAKLRGRLEGKAKEAEEKADLKAEAEGLAEDAPDDRLAKDANGKAAGGKGTSQAEQPRREMPEAGRWFPAVVTDEAGKAVVTIPMPENTTQWRLTSRGCSVETLVGEATANTITRKDFFVSIKAPGLLQEGDRIRVLARVHNLTDYEGPAELSLTLTGGPEPVKLAEKAQVRKRGNTEVLFENAVVPPAIRLELEVAAKAGDLQDTLVKAVPIRPWGLEYAGHAGGTAKDDYSVTVQLPAGQEYSATWMTVLVSPRMERVVLDLALNPGVPILRPVPMEQRTSRDAIIYPPPPPVHGTFAGGELLAAVSGLAYGTAVQAADVDCNELRERVRSLISEVVVTQRDDGGWAWQGGASGSDCFVSSMSYWALSEARKLGLPVDPPTFDRAGKFLQNVFQQVAATDNDAKAVILHAQSVAKVADFANVNRLYRERNTLSPPALAYTALALASLERNEMAAEVLQVLETRKQEEKTETRTLCRWDGTGAHAWLNDRVEATAIALLALARVKPASPMVQQAVDYLLSQKGCYGFQSAKARGPVVAALACYYGKTKFEKTDYRLAITVNGKPLKTLEAKGEQSSVLIPVPAELVAKGPNKVEFDLEGRGEYAYAATIRGFSGGLKDPGSWQYPHVIARHYRHAPLTYRGNPISAGSTSPVQKLEVGQRVNVWVDIWEAHYGGYLTIEEHLPAGMILVDGSLQGRFKQVEFHDSKIVMHFPPGDYCSDIAYQLVAYSTGDYRVLPMVMRDAVQPSLMRVGPSGQLSVLKYGEKSSDPYQMNDDERYALGVAYFNDGRYDDAIKYLAELFQRNRTYNEREVARMLLWIHTSQGYYDAKRVVEMFEVLRERYPDLFIPFDKILVVGRAYRDIGEFERAWLVFRATTDASFINDSNVSAILQDEGQFLGSVDFQEDLWREYPDTPEVVSSYFALSQTLYQQAPNAHLLATKERQIALSRGKSADTPRRVPNKFEMLKECIRMLSGFLTLYQGNPLCDDASFSMANAFLDLRDYPTVVRLSDVFKTRYEKSEFVSSFQYMAALGHFWQNDYENALKAAEPVANGASKDRDYSRYILGQIYHARGKPGNAIQWYATIKEQYPDAKEAIDYFEEKRVAMEEISIVRPGEPVELKLKYRNIKEANLQVYRVDLMKLYLREKNLSNITQVKLAGIKPEMEAKIQLGDGKDYVDKEKAVKLDLKDEAAYLVIGRGDDLFASGMVLITPLKIEVQEDPESGRLRANVLDAVKGGYRANIHVKAIGTKDSEFRSGETDLRGIFVGDNLRGKATVIAREGDSRYAFYRGEKWLGAPETAPPAPQPAAQRRPAQDYQSNLRQQNEAVQQMNLQQFDQMRRGKASGVQVKAAE